MTTIKKSPLRWLVPLVALMLLASGCAFFASANRYAAAPGTVTEPWWCTPNGAALNTSDCQALSLQLDAARLTALAHPHASDAQASGATPSAYVVGVGAAFRFSGPTPTFDVGHPDTLLYAGTDAQAQIAGVEWNVNSGSAAPSGLAGNAGTWTDVGGGVWRLRAWIVRPFEDQPDVFAATHPCLAAGGPVYDVTASCYSATHPNPLQILVGNDDGYSAPGIDAAVQALRALPNVQVTVVAPATNQSATGDQTTPGGVTATQQQTLSGYPATAVNGFPADGVVYALNTMHLNPDLVVSGINFGQNLAQYLSMSGTVGVARTASKQNIPSIAVSQGFAGSPDFPSGAAALTTWVNDFRLGRAGPPFQVVANMNIPTCSGVGSIRGTLILPAATDTNGRPYNPSNCLSTVPPSSFHDDLDGFLNGYTTLADIGLG